MKNLPKVKLRVFLKILLLNIVALSSANAFFTDYSLPKVVGVKSVIDRNSVGFEWKSLAKYKNVTGINVYRAVAKKGTKQVYIKIDSIVNRFATHYVDRTAKPNTRYFYTFTTASGLSESLYGDIIPVKTNPPYKAVKFVEARLVDRGIVKLLWVPHTAPTITEYIIQRKRTNEKRWYYLETIKGRLYPEYIDATAKRGYRYDYRVFARDANEMYSLPSKILSVEVK